MKKRIRKLVIWRILCAVLTNVSASGAQWHARGQRFDPAILHQKITVLHRKYGAFLFAEADFWGMHSSNCTIHGYEDEHGVWLLPQAAVGWYVY